MQSKSKDSRIVSFRVFISGRVQGVGYRFWTRHQANQLGLNGWVRNLPNGQVEALFQGDKLKVEQMIQLCHQGPAAAIVDHVIFHQEVCESLTGFVVK